MGLDLRLLLRFRVRLLLRFRVKRLLRFRVRLLLRFRLRLLFRFRRYTPHLSSYPLSPTECTEWPTMLNLNLSTFLHLYTWVPTPLLPYFHPRTFVMYLS